MSDWHEAARLIHEAHPEWTMRRIGECLGVGQSAVWKVLNPEKAREIRRADNARRREYKKAHQRMRDRAPEVRGTCVNPCCSNVRGIGHQNQTRGRGYCAECARVIADVRRALGEGMWADGWTCREIADAFGVGTTAYITGMRAEGWDLPHRRTPEQVARITAGTRRGQGLAA